MQGKKERGRGILQQIKRDERLSLVPLYLRPLAHNFFQSGTGSKNGNLFRLDVDHLTGLWISGLPCSTLADGKSTESYERNAIALFEGFLNGAEDTLHSNSSLLFGDRSLSYQKLFRILDQIRMAGLQRISLQSEVDKKP